MPSSSTPTRTSATTSTGCAGGPTRCSRSSTASGSTRSFTFCLDEPDREPAFTRRERPHARVRRGRARTGSSRSCGSTSTESPIDEASRCLDLGARGIKLHPRAQKFSVGDERLDAGLRARGRARRPDPDPRRPRAAADRRPPRRARRALRRRAADHRPRRHRRPGRPRRTLRARPGRLLRHLGVERRRPRST